MSATVRAIIHGYATIEARNVIDQLLLEKIDMDRAVKFLVAKRALSDMERHILMVASQGHSKSSGAKELGISRWLYGKLLASACRKICKFLGWEYSDKRTLQIIENKIKRELNPDELGRLVEILRVYTLESTTGDIFDG